jgi:hypothetical protein
MACINRPFSKQSGATCWFHAIMNGFVTSKYGQVIMYRALSKYISEHVTTKKELEDFMSPNLTCVRPGQLYSRFNFYKWFYHWLVIGIPVNRNTRAVMRNIVTNKRSSNIDQHALPAQGLFDILGRMDIHDYSVADLHTGVVHKDHPDPSFIVYAASKIDKNNPLGGFGSFIPAQITIANRTFRCDHASIGVFFEQGGAHSAHAITGIRCMNDGSPKLIDSNSDALYSCDWSVPSTITTCQEYVQDCMRLYHSPPSSPIILFVVFTPLTMRLNNLNNIRPNKIINRYSHAMNR